MIFDVIEQVVRVEVRGALLKLASFIGLIELVTLLIEGTN